MFSTGSVVVSNNSRARSMRASVSQAIGGSPVSSRNRRVSVRRDTCACVARVSRSSGRARFFSIQSRSAASWSSLDSGRNLFDELRLPSLSLWWSDERACPVVGRGGAVVAPDDVEAQVDPGRDPGGREDVAVVDEQAVRTGRSRGGTGSGVRGTIASAWSRGARRGVRWRRERMLLCRSIRGGRGGHAPPARRQGRSSTPFRRRPHSLGRSRSRLGRELGFRLTR